MRTAGVLWDGRREGVQKCMVEGQWGGGKCGSVSARGILAMWLSLCSYLCTVLYSVLLNEMCLYVVVSCRRWGMGRKKMWEVERFFAVTATYHHSWAGEGEWERGSCVGAVRLETASGIDSRLSGGRVVD